MNHNFKLDEKIPNFKIFGKILKYLHERFKPNFTIIKKSKDVDFL